MRFQVGQLTFMVRVPQVGRSFETASGASEIAAAEIPGLCPMTMRWVTRGPTRTDGAQDVITLGEVQPVVGLQQARRDAKDLRERLGSFTRARGRAREDQVRHQAALEEAPRHFERFVLTLPAQGAFEVANVGVVLGVGVAYQREALRVFSSQTRTSTRPALSRASKMRSGS